MSVTAGLEQTDSESGGNDSQFCSSVGIYDNDAPIHFIFYLEWRQNETYDSINPM